MKAVLGPFVRLPPISPWDGAPKIQQEKNESTAPSLSFVFFLYIGSCSEKFIIDTMVTTIEDITERPIPKACVTVSNEVVYKAVEGLDLEKVKEIVDHHIDNLNLYFSNNTNKDDEELFDDQEYLSHDLLNIIDDEFNTPLHKLIEKKLEKESEPLRLQIIEELVVRGKVRCDVVNSDGLTPLLLAVKKNRPAIVSLLIKHGKYCTANDKCQVAPYIGYTSLHCCCTWALVEVQSESENEDNTLKTSRDLESMARLVISLGADVNSKNSEGETPLHTCARNGTLNVARLLVAEGANVNALNKHKVTPLMIACTLGNLSMVDLLLDTELQEEGNVSLKNNPLQVDVQDQMGDTALHFAFQSQLQRVFTNGIEVSEDHERIAYRLVYAGKANLDVYSKDEYLATDFTSESFKCILRTVSQHAHLFPQNLDLLLALPDNLLASPYLDPKERSAFVKAVQQHKKERQESNDAESKKGGCPMVTGNKSLMKKRGQKVAESSPAKTPKEETVTPPPGHGAGGDISKCPFMKNKQPASTDAPKEGAPSDSTTTTEEPKGKCPIPYHNELMMICSKQNLIYLLVLVLCVVLARVL